MNATTDTRSRLSWLWVFVMFNMIFADILSFMMASVLQGFLDGRAEQIVITPMFVLGAAIATEIPIAMALLSQILPQRVARWTNIVVAVYTIVYVLGGMYMQPHYIFLASMETIAGIAIVWTAWRWNEGVERVKVGELAEA